VQTSGQTGSRIPFAALRLSSRCKNGAAMKAAILADATLKTVPAVADGRIVALTEKYRGSTSHYMAYAAEELARACYPDRFPA